MGGRTYKKSKNLGLPLHWNDGGMTDGHLHNALAEMLDSLLYVVRSWKQPVALVGDLPVTGNEDGDARVVIADAEIYVWVQALGGWQSSTIGGDPHWKAPVADSGSLPPTGNNSGDVRLTLDTMTLYGWNGSAWQILVALDMTHEAYSFSTPAVVTNAYINTAGGMPSNFAGYPQRGSGTLVSISAAMAVASTCTVEIWEKGVGILDTLLLTGATFGTKASGVAVPANSEISCRINGTGNGPVVTVVVE